MENFEKRIMETMETRGEYLIKPEPVDFPLLRIAREMHASKPALTAQDIAELDKPIHI